MFVAQYTEVHSYAAIQPVTLHDSASHLSSLLFTGEE